MFHFNKKHLEDQTIPMWVIKTHGETFYVNHVDCEVPWSTKETPENSHTKGSIKVKNVLLTIDDHNAATLKTLAHDDKIRLDRQRLGITRIIFRWGSDMHTALQAGEFEHSVLKDVEGACSSIFVICDLLDAQQVTFAALKYNFRVLSANEAYYRAYDQAESVVWELDEDDNED